MTQRRKYRKKSTARVVAVQLDLQTDGFTYQKWGGAQTCKAGDWIVNNAGETYTVDRESFAQTYRAVSPGVFEKVGIVWAEVAAAPGQIRTKEGATCHEAGDFLVSNDASGRDSYAVSAQAFKEMYEPID